MHIIEVIPLINLPPQVPQLLSYFYSKPLPRGSLVEIILNNRRVSAVVISSSSLEERKITLKKYGFQLKKLSSVISEQPVLSEIQFKIAIWLSKNYFAPLGMCFKTVLPPFFGNKKHPFIFPNLKSQDTITVKPTIIISSAKKVINNINDGINKTMKQKKQVLIILPEISVAKYFYNYFAGYHETSFLHSSISPLKAHKEWQNISSHEVEVIIGTRQALMAPFANLGLIVMEDPANEAYKSDMTPKYNTRDLALKIAEIYSSELLFVSSMSDIINYSNILNNKLKLIDKRSAEKINITSENMFNEIRSGNFNIFSRELKNNIEKYMRDNKKILIFSTRKGYSSSLLCGNCGFYFKCPQCSVPFKIYKSRDSLVCHKCSSFQKIPDHCSNCNSFKLKSAGFAGSEKISEELEHVLNVAGIKKDIFIFDSSTVKNLKQESELVKKMTALDSFICIATQSIFGRRYELNFDLVGIPNIDSLTTFPDFKAEEDLFLQFEKLLDFEAEKIIIQTFDPDGKMAELLMNRNHQDFYKKELPVRELFLYPPFSRLVKLAFSSKDRNKAGYEARILNEKLKLAIAKNKLDDKIKILGPSPAFIEKQRNMYNYNLILKVLPDIKPDEIIKYVPSSWSIDVDPRSIL